MKIDFEKKLLNITGVALKFEGDVDMTLKSASIASLMAVLEDERGLSGVEKFERYQLAQKINGGADEYSAEEIAKIKLLIGKVFGAVVVGPAYAILEGKE